MEWRWQEEQPLTWHVAAKAYESAASPAWRSLTTFLTANMYSADIRL